MSDEWHPKILIIDDDEVVAATTQALLSADGYDVSIHTTAFGGSSMILETRPDLVLLDVNMPGLSGPGLADVVQGEVKADGVKIFFYSSTSAADLQALVEDTGIDGYIRKGDRDELRRRVARALLR